MNDAPYRHPAEITSDRLKSALKMWPDAFSADERAMVEKIQGRLAAIATGAIDTQWPPPEIIADPTLADRIVAEYQSGTGVRTLAGSHKIGRRAVERLLAERNVPRMQRGEARKIDAGALDKAVQVYLAGESLKEAGASIGVSGMTVARHMDRRGIPRRSQGDRR
jgi:hypothetical protein